MSSPNSDRQQTENKDQTENKKKNDFNEKIKKTNSKEKEMKQKTDASIESSKNEKSLSEAMKSLLTVIEPLVSEKNLQTVNGKLTEEESKSTKDTKSSENLPESKHSSPKAEHSSSVANKDSNSSPKKETEKIAPKKNVMNKSANEQPLNTKESKNLNNDVKLIIESLKEAAVETLQTVEQKEKEKASKKAMDSQMKGISDKSAKQTVDTTSTKQTVSQVITPVSPPPLTKHPTVPVVKLLPPSNIPVTIKSKDIQSVNGNLKEPKMSPETTKSIASAPSPKSVAVKDSSVNSKELTNKELDDKVSTVKGMSASEAKAVKKIETLLPAEFRKDHRPKSVNMSRTTKMKIITFDKTYLFSCSGMKQQIVLLVFAIKMLICILVRTCPDYIFSDARRCPIAEGYLFVNLVGGTIVLVLLVCYTFHVVEAFDGFQWLFAEFVFYGTLGTMDILYACFIFGYGGFFVIVGILGLYSGCLLMVLTGIKWYKYLRGDIAQPRRDDPDGNIARQYAPNIRFKGHHGKQIRMWTI